MANYLERLKETGFSKRNIGVHKDTDEIVTLEQVEAELHNLQPVNDLSEGKKKELVLAYWNTGGWSDYYHGPDFISLEIALDEVAKDSDLGAEFLKDGARALEMIREDLEKHYIKSKWSR